MNSHNELEEALAKAASDVALTPSVETQVMQRIAGSTGLAAASDRHRLFHIVPRWGYAAAAACIIAAVFILLAGHGSSVFAATLEKLRSSEYTFTITTQPLHPLPQTGRAMSFQSAPHTGRGFVLEPGRMRIELENAVGRSYVVIDQAAGKKLTMIDESNIKRAFLRDLRDEDPPWLATSAFSFVQGSLQTLWGLHNGKQKDLGTKEIDGQIAKGFQVDQITPHYEQKIRIWAAKRTAQPLLVEFEILSPRSEDAAVVRITHFQLNVPMDESQFSLQVPEGYVASGSLRMQDLAAGPTVGQAATMVRLLDLCRQGHQDDAIEVLLSVDWTTPMEFSANPPVFGMSEKQMWSLDSEERGAVVIQAIHDTRCLAELARQAVRLGDEAVQRGQVDEGERLYKSVLNLGHTLDRNPESMLISRQTGTGLRCLALEQMIALYKQTGRSADEAAARQELNAIYGTGR
jgi:outer membrane lipoprotein-sorting protein